MNIKKCELCCKKRARMYCESDQASLCFDCDSNVHSANFLVAKHSRNLLCHSCSNTTPWSASGPKLSPTLSICNSCIENPSTVQLRNERVEENYQLDTYDDHSDDEYVSSSDDESDIDDDDKCEDDGNQVVPLPSSSSLSGAGDGGGAREEGGGGGCCCCSSSPWKRLRESDCLHSEDEETCSSSIGFVRPMKALRTNELCE